ncbi:MAG: flagellar hook-basal body complex protein [Rickettsiales bacterium]
MSLYGALFGGVSGLKAQSSKIGTISDNIANVNTIGYKQATATFSSLVVNTSSAVSYQTGGVRAGTRLDISKQGLLASSESPTDLAISGGGFFVVSSIPDRSVGGTAATPLYSRAGNFTPDSLGNFVNSNGFYLQGWPLDRDGRLPGEVGNLNTTSSSNFDSLEAVNVESASGVAQGTSTIALGANLKSSEVIYPGASGLLTPDTNNPANQNLAADQIQVGSEFGLAPADSVRRGDTFLVSTGNGNNLTYEYGGFTVGRSVSTLGGANNYGDSNLNNTPIYVLGAATDVEYAAGSSFIITSPNHGLISGDTVTLSGFGALGLTPAGQINGTHTVTRIDANRYQITVNTAHGQLVGSNPAFAAGRLEDIRQFQGNVLDAISANGPFFNLTSSATYTPASLTFTITTATAGAQTFRYAASAPNTLSGQFNSLNTLATAINAINGLTARVVSGRLVVAAEDARQAITFANGDATGTATLHGIDWIAELGLANITQTSTARYASLQGLANLVTADQGVSATVNNPLSNSTLNIRVDDPLSTISFTDSPYSSPIPAGTTVTVPGGTYLGTPATPVIVQVVIAAVPPAGLANGNSVYISGLTGGIGGLPGGFPNGGPFVVSSVGGATYTIDVPITQSIVVAGGAVVTGVAASASIAGVSNQGSPLAHFNIAGTASLNSVVPSTIAATGLLGPQYDPSGAVGDNMASGEITAQFSRNVRIYDNLGSGHDVRFSYIKIAQNSWAVEVHAIPASDVSTPLVNGQIATGTVNFNGDGTLNNVSASLSTPLSITWTNGSSPSAVTLNLGTAGSPFGTTGATTIGLSDGLSQFDSAYNVNFANQNGAPVGQLVSVAIDKDGIVTASYSNGQTQALFKLPLASFANPDGLDALSGNVFTQNRSSGEVNLREAGSNGTGSIVAAALEQSNVDLAEQLTDIIVAQRSYQANTKVIKTTDELLQELNQI